MDRDFWLFAMCAVAISMAVSYPLLTYKQPQSQPTVYARF